MRPAATSVNYVYAIGLTEPIRLFGVTLVVIFFHARTTNQSTVTGVPLCLKNVELLCLDPNEHKERSWEKFRENRKFELNGMPVITERRDKNPGLTKGFEYF